jgi:hypothetical protein
VVPSLAPFVFVVDLLDLGVVGFEDFEAEDLVLSAISYAVPKKIARGTLLFTKKQ